MTAFMCIAFTCGIFVSLNLNINSKLTSHKGAVNASFCNHLFGFLLLLTLLPLFFSFTEGTPYPLSLPIYLYSGAALGVILVALFSWLILQIGATHATLLMICGQMIASTGIDLAIGRISHIPFQVLGIGFICVGLWATQRALKREQSPSMHDVQQPLEQQSIDPDLGQQPAAHREYSNRSDLD